LTTPLNILLVEDHDTTLEILARLLRQMGHRVTGANSVATGIAAASRDGFDLLISDLGLPDGSGLDLMRQLKQKYAGPIDRAHGLRHGRRHRRLPRRRVYGAPDQAGGAGRIECGDRSRERAVKRLDT
jgi:CheY-like chemotaxis protein